MKQIDTYDASFFDCLREAEESHFWFQVRRKWIFDRIRRVIPPPARILEIGCGTGNVSSFLSQKGYTVIGCEFYRTALEMAWPGFLRVQGNSESLPFRDGSFDIIGLFDVIEHFENDTRPIIDALRLLRDGGIVAVTVPARQELWSSLDEISLHRRRYNRDRLGQIFSESGLSPLLFDYMFLSLYLPMKLLRRERKEASLSFRINRQLNTILKGLFDIERYIARLLPLPIGTSLLGVARKDRLPQ